MIKKETRRGIFITGTDTGVGKTYIACAVARALRTSGVDVGVMKPVATGDRNDVRALMKAAGIAEDLDRVNPVFLKRPLAALAAARLENRTVDVGAVRENFRALRRAYEFMIVEGAGGLMVPVTERHSMLDLIADFALPVAVVARPGLGTVNHTVLTVDRLVRRGLTVAGIVLSGFRNRTLAEKTNPGLLREMTGLPVLCVGPDRGIDNGLPAWLGGPGAA